MCVWYMNDICVLALPGCLKHRAVCRRWKIDMPTRGAGTGSAMKTTVSASKSPAQVTLNLTIRQRWRRHSFVRGSSTSSFAEYCSHSLHHLMALLHISEILSVLGVPTTCSCTHSCVIPTIRQIETRERYQLANQKTAGASIYLSSPSCS